jgi:hypothetical protein
VRAESFLARRAVVQFIQVYNFFQTSLVSSHRLLTATVDLLSVGERRIRNLGSSVISTCTSMPRIRFKCPSLHSSVISSELAEQAYQRRLLPVREDLLSDDAVFNCIADDERRKSIALEVLTKYMRVLDSDDKPAMDVDISYPTWIREKLMLQLLPEPLVRCASDGGLVPVRPVEACAWFEDDTWSNGSMTYDSGDMCPMVQEIEDLPCKPTTPSKKLLVEPSSPVDSSTDEDFKKSKVICSKF